jgi:hypothetical protein
MSEPRTVYAISSGCYSDYSVSCIFETLEDAKDYLLKSNGAITLKQGEWTGHEEGQKPDFYDDRIEEFQFYPAGVVPHADA